MQNSTDDSSTQQTTMEIDTPESEVGHSGTTQPHSSTIHLPRHLTYKPPNIIPKKRTLRVEPSSSEFYNHDYEECRRKVETFWEDKREEIRNAPKSFFTDAINNKAPLPLARIKKIMRIDSDLDSQMISQDAPIFLAKVCELFIEELTLKAWKNTEEQRRKTLQKCDLVATRLQNPHMDFLVDFLPRQNGPYTDVYTPEGKPVRYQTSDKTATPKMATPREQCKEMLSALPPAYTKDGKPVKPTFPMQIEIRPIKADETNEEEDPQGPHCFKE